MGVDAPVGDPVRTDFPGGSWQSRVLAPMVRGTVKPALRAWAPTRSLPWPTHLVDYLGILLPLAPGATHRQVDLPRCGANLVVPACASSDRFVIYLHGGGFHDGGRHLHRHMIGRFADQLSAPVLHVDYRKLPRHPVSAAVADAMDAYRHVLELGVDPARILIMGDSAGGYLSFTTALGARTTGLPMPGALVAMAPLADWDLTAKSVASTAASCAVFSPAVLRAFAAAAGRVAGEHQLLSPATCDVSGLPPTLIQVSSTEMLYPDAVSMARRLTAHGVPCELQVWDRQIHVFQAAAGWVPEATRAVAEVVTFVDTAIPRRDVAPAA